MNNFHQKKQKVLQILQVAVKLSKKLERNEIAQEFHKAFLRLQQEKLFVVVCGEFKQGKSKLINAYLNESELFPVDVDITTSQVSTISYAEKENISVYIGHSGESETKIINRDEISQYVTEAANPKNKKQVSLITMESPVDQLKKQGIVIVDTPGIGAMNKDHTVLTLTFIPNADVILFVSDVLKPLSTNELDFIDQRILPYTREIIFVATKCDSLSDVQLTDVLESNRKKLIKRMDCPADVIQIIPVSSNKKYDYRVTNDPEDLQDSNFQLLERVLQEFLNEKKGRLILLHALSELIRYLNHLREPLQAELEACNPQGTEKRQSLLDQLKLTENRINDLSNDNAVWRRKLEV